MSKKNGKSLWKEFTEFAIKGNAMALAVGTIIGGAFGTITKSLTEDLIMPIVNIFLGGTDFSELKVELPRLFPVYEEKLNEVTGVMEKVEVPNELTYGNTALELETCMLVCGENRIRLSAKEFDVMRFLLQSREQILSKEVILARVWGYDSNAVENHVEVYVGFLRKKLRSIGSNVSIEAARRLGYHLEVKEDC